MLRNAINASDRLSDERSLSNVLGSLAETDLLIQAPETLESSLLGAFRLATAEKNSVRMLPYYR